MSKIVKKYLRIFEADETSKYSAVQNIPKQNEIFDLCDAEDSDIAEVVESRSRSKRS